MAAKQGWLSRPTLMFMCNVVLVCRFACDIKLPKKGVEPLFVHQNLSYDKLHEYSQAKQEPYPLFCNFQSQVKYWEWASATLQVSGTAIISIISLKLDCIFTLQQITCL